MAILHQNFLVKTESGLSFNTTVHLIPAAFVAGIGFSDFFKVTTWSLVASTHLLI
jgi:hypothetical protein